MFSERPGSSAQNHRKFILVSQYFLLDTGTVRMIGQGIVHPKALLVPLRTKGIEVPGISLSVRVMELLKQSPSEGKKEPVQMGERHKSSSNNHAQKENKEPVHLCRTW